MTVVCLGFRAGFAEAARRRGHAVHFVVEKVKPALRGHAYTKVTDLAGTEEVLRAVTAALGGGVTAVVTGHEQALFTAAVLRSVLGLPGDTDAGRCPRFRDKRVQKAALPPELPRAACEYLTAEPDWAELSGRLGPRVVVKPADGYGSQATSLITGPEELAAYLGEHPVRSDVQTVAESYSDGREIHVDGVWAGGRTRWQATSAYLGQLMGWTGGTSVGDAPLAGADPVLEERAAAFATEVLTALDAPDTVFHLEAFAAADGTLILGEVAARVAGGLTADTLGSTFGVDLYGAALDLALGETPVLPESGKAPELVYGYVFLNHEPGQELTEAAFRERFDFVELDYPAPGAGRTGSYGRCGHAVLAAPGHAALDAGLRAVAAFSKGA